MDYSIDLDKVSRTYVKEGEALEIYLNKCILDIIRPYISNDACALELGCAKGFSTSFLVQLFSSITVCDGSNIFLEEAKEKLINYNNIKYNHIYFEQITYSCEFDVVFANFILEHVENVDLILEKIYLATKPGGYCIITVPNAKSLSRQLAVKMGLFDSIYSLTENDKNHGHLRIFDMESLLNHISNSKFKLIDKGGLFVKPFADFQMNMLVQKDIIDETHFDGLRELAKDYPELSGHIYVILKREE